MCLRRLAVVGLMTSACAADDSASRDTASPVSSGDTIIADSVTADIVDRRTIIYFFATDSAIEALRGAVPAEDFPVIADDLMFYRASAIEHLDSMPQPYMRETGRHPMTFRVAGTPRTYDFADVELLDFIVLYEPDHEPRIIAPNEVHSIADYVASGALR